MDKYRIDSHKLIYHVKRVSDWLDDKVIYPIYVEISPSGACNFRCTYCAFDFMDYQPRFLDADVLKTRISEMAMAGVKSIVFAGEGEPLLNKNIGDIIVHTKNEGIDIGLVTNAVLYNNDLADKTLGSITWIKVSIAGATKETHAKVHQTSTDDLEKVINNMSYAAKVREKNGYKTTLGMQLLLLPENEDEAVQLAKKAKEIGMDYLVIKPYSQHPLSKTEVYKDIKYGEYLHLAKELEKISDDKFSVIFRMNTMKKWDEKERNYDRCLALPFWAYIDAGGNVYGCFNYLGDERFNYGNIYDNTFNEIWESEKRKKSLEWVHSEMEASECRVNCRMDEINRYLWELRHPPEHTNFI